MKKTEIIKTTPWREARQRFLPFAYLIFREDNFAVYLKPIRSMTAFICQITNRQCAAGDYYYPVTVAPMTLWPHGHERVCVEAITKANVREFIRNGYYAVRVPAMSEISDTQLTESMKRQQQKALERAATKLLTDKAKRI